MNRTQKALMFAGQWVNTNLLEEGVYTQPSPALYPEYETIEGLEEKAQAAAAFFGRSEWFPRFRENLRKCKLVTVKITIEHESD